jgi:hypothetical protein
MTRSQAIGAKLHKYRAQAVTVDGIRFASKKEARRWSELKLLVQAGQIEKLERQPKFNFIIGGQYLRIRSKCYPNGRNVSYSADFSYWAAGRRIVEDVKGFDTTVSRLKRALVEAIYGVEVTIV